LKHEPFHLSLQDYLVVAKLNYLDQTKTMRFPREDSFSVFTVYMNNA